MHGLDCWAVASLDSRRAFHSTTASGSRPAAGGPFNETTAVGIFAAGCGGGLQPIPDRLVVLTFDDSVKSQFTVVRPALLERGFGATFFITEGWDFSTNKQDYMSWGEIAQLHQDGFEIGNHTRSHLGVTDANVGQLEEELRAIAERCREHGIPAPTSFAYPGNSITPLAFPVLRANGILLARRGGAPERPYAGGRGFALQPGVDHPLLLPSAGDARPEWTLDDFIRAVEQARDGRVAILQFHGTPDRAHPWVSTSPEKFISFLDYLAARRFRVIALRDLTRHVDPASEPADPMLIIRVRKEAIERGETRRRLFEEGNYLNGRAWRRLETRFQGVQVAIHGLFRQPAQFSCPRGASGPALEPGRDPLPAHGRCRFPCR